MTVIHDNNNIPGLIKQLRSLRERSVQIGIVASGGDEIYMIAHVHEYGIDIKVTEKMRGWFLANGMPLRKSTTHIRIPERSYFRTGFDANKSAISNEAENAVDKLLQGDITAYEAREEVGEFASGKIRDNVTSVGLVKTGKLKDAIGFRVVKR